MLEKKRSPFYLSILVIGVFILLVMVSTPATVYADDPHPTSDNGNCITCHEDLYFLHDTGNWYCLKESPMACVDCHGGNPIANTEELAHTERTAHPVINDDISKCQQCHPNECTERLQIFDETAGISKILVAAPYNPSYSSDYIPANLVEAEQEPVIWVNALEILPMLFVIGITLIAYLAYRVRHTTKREP